MGSYCQLYISNYAVDCSKGSVDPWMLSFFSSRDKKSFKRRVGDHPYYVWNEPEKDVDLNENEEIYEYSISSGEAIDRLEALGFSLKKANKSFIKDKNTFIRYKERLFKNYGNKFKTFDYSFLYNFSFNDLLYAIKQSVSCGIKSWNIKDLIPEKERNIYQYIYMDDNNFGFSGIKTDPRYVYRTILETVSPKSYVVLDYAPLVYAGNYTKNEDLCSPLTNALDKYALERIFLNQSIIVLTEGQTDAIILEQSFKALFPYMTKYFSFMDFGISNVAGGAPSLVNQVKAFTGLKLGIPIIAIFDNDTAANEALKNLDKIEIPKTIKILQLPTLAYCNQYPTIGPQGLIKTNINGLACSIESFFGKDILTDKNGNLTPVQWKGFNPTLKQYQGELINKSELQNKFAKKVEYEIKHPQKDENYDWKPMKKLLLKIIKAFK